MNAQGQLEGFAGSPGTLSRMAGTLAPGALRNLVLTTDRALGLSLDAMCSTSAAHKQLDPEHPSACALARAAGHLDDARREITLARDVAAGRKAAA